MNPTWNEKGFQQTLYGKSKHILRNRADCEIMWKYIAEQDTPQTTTRSMRIACWITKATDTHSEYVILISFSLQKWLRERASMLRYACIVCFVPLLNLRSLIFG
jgi:hypothetical protein